MIIYNIHLKNYIIFIYKKINMLYLYEIKDYKMVNL